MVTCSVCATEFAETRTECPCCNHVVTRPVPLAPPPPAPKAGPPPLPNAPVAPVGAAPFNDSGPLPRSFSPPIRPPGMTPAAKPAAAETVLPPPPSPPLPAALPPPMAGAGTPPEIESLAPSVPPPAVIPLVRPLPPVTPPPPVVPIVIPPVRALVVPPVQPRVVTPIVTIAPPRPVPVAAAVQPPPEVLENIRTEDLAENPVRPRPRAWRVRLITPDASPAALPPLLPAARPWEDGLAVEFEIGEERDGETHPLAEAWVKWRLRSTREDGAFPGRVLESDQSDHGDWTTDAQGRIRFRFAPTRENALLFAGPAAESSAQFDVFLPDESGQPGQPLPPAGAAEEAGAASLLLGWAPAFDLGVFKLPFFIASDAPLPLSKEPDPETVPTLAWRLGGSEPDYRGLFRDGGELTLSLQVADPGDETVAPFRLVLEHARVVVGVDGQREGEARQILEFSKLGEAVAGGVKIVFPPSPDARAAARKVALNADIGLHPVVRRELMRVVEACLQLEQDLASCPQLEPAVAFNADGRTSFRALAGQFLADAASVLCAARQATLISKRQAFRDTLSAMRDYLGSTATTWRRLGASVELHRNSFRRLETVFLNFYRDFLLWGLVHDKLAAGWQALRTACPWLSPEVRLNAPPESLLATVQSALVKSALEIVLRPQLARWREHWLRQMEALGAAAKSSEEASAAAGQALETAELQLQEALASVERQTDDLSALLARQAISAAPATAELAIEQSAAHRSLLEALRLIRRAAVQRDRRARARVLTALEKRAAATEREACATGGERCLAEGLRQIEQSTGTWESVVTAAQPAADQEVLKAQHAETLDYLREQQSRRKEVAEGLGAKLAKLRDRLRPLVGETGVAAANLEREFGALDSILADEHARTRAALETAAELWPARLAAAATIRRADEEARRAQLGEALREASSGGAAFLQSSAGAEPPVPPGGIDPGFARQLGEFVQSCLAGALRGLSAAGLGTIGVLAGLARFLIVAPLSLLVHLTARFGARVAEALTALFDATLNLRGGLWTTTALSAPVLQTGLAELRKLSGNPEKFFAFPYVKERVVLTHLAETADNLRQNHQLPDRASEQFVEEALRTGYDYYYPNQLKQARLLLFGLCQRALSRETLSLAPGHRETAARVGICQAAGDALEREIGAVEERAARADGTAEPFAAPLVGLVKGERWSLATLGDSAQWCGWLMAWTFRLAALVLGLAAWWHPPALALAASMLAASTPAAGIAVTVRRLFEVGGHYPYSAAYPRDLLALQAAQCAVLFGTESERLPVQSATDFVKGYPS